MNKFEQTDTDIKIKVKVIFFRNKREKFPQLNSNGYIAYRPHFIVKGTSDYLGIQFQESKLEQFDIEGDAIIKTLYTVDYSRLVTGTEFDIVEGSKVVGEGIVL